MVKKTIALSLISLICFTALQAKEKEKIGRGWLQYEDAPQQKNEGNTKKSPERMSEKDILLSILQEQKKQTKLQEEILHVLKVTNDLPEMIKVNGKECLSNSSAECFKMPITKDAARIPVMKRWMEEPTVENAKAYYEWQSKLLNQVSDAGYSLNLASISTPPILGDVPVSVSDGTADPLKQRDDYVFNNIIKKMSKNMELDILIGKTFGFDIDRAIRIFDIYDKYKSIGIKVKFVFSNQKALDNFAYANKSAPAEIYGKRWAKIDPNDKVISPNTFKDPNIAVYITPMYVLRFNDFKKKIHINQVIGVGNSEFEDIYKSTINTLILNKVIEPKEINGINAQKENLKKMIIELDSASYINENRKKEKAQYFKNLLEKEINNNEK